MGLEYQPASEPLHISVNLPRRTAGIEDPPVVSWTLRLVRISFEGPCVTYGCVPDQRLLHHLYIHIYSQRARLGTPCACQDVPEAVPKRKYLRGLSESTLDLFGVCEYLSAFFVIGIRRLASLLQNPFVRERGRHGGRERERERARARERERENRLRAQRLASSLENPFAPSTSNLK